MTGQDAVNVAESFAEAAEFDGVVMTKLDGDARGGAALSVKAVTGKPILFASTGEKLEAFERFHPDRMASRILGMGDVLSLIEKAEQQVDEDEAEDLQRKLENEQFTLEDFLKQMRQVRKMGPLSGLIGMMPGMGAMKQLKNADVDEGELDRVEAIILSMTPRERGRPGVDQRLPAQADRRRLGDQGPAVKQLVKQFDQMQADEEHGDAARCRPRSRSPSCRPAGRRDRRCGAASRFSVTSAVQWQSESDLEGWVPRRTRSGASSSPTNARRVTGARSRRSATTTRRPSPRRSIVDEERAQHWLDHGAQPSETVATLLRTKGIAASGS